MFWKFATTSNIDTLLEKEDVTLRDLMDDDDVLQECKGQNTKLVEYLCKLDVMKELVALIVTDPSEESDDALKYKYPNIACDLLTCDIPQINDMLGETECLREKLFSFLENESVLNPLLASFFSKVIGILLSRKAEPTLEFIKMKDDFLGSILKHLETSAIMDLLLRLVTCVEAVDLRAEVLSWLNENNLVERLIGLIDPYADDDFHCNSAQSLCDIIRLSREHMYTMQESAQEDPLLATLERKETVQLLLKHMFDNGINESVITNGITVLLALLEIRRPAPFGFPEMAPELTQLDVERLACGVSKTLHGLSDRLTDFHHLLENPPRRQIMRCTFGELRPPLGNTRLHVGKLFSAILITNTHNINVQLSELQIFNALLDLFFRYEYNNFLHTQVVQCVQTVLGNAVTVTAPGRPCCSHKSNSAFNEQGQEDDDVDNPRKVAPLLTHIFEDCRIIQRILDAWEDNQSHEADVGGHRKGNMGHLTLITNQIIENMEKGANSERIQQFIEGMPEEDQDRWRKFVAEPLAEVNDKNSRELGGHNPMHFSSDDDGETDYRDIPFSSNSAQQAFTNYQIQQITSDFIDQFGFNDGEFVEQDQTDKFNKISSIDFDIHVETSTANQDLFEDVCKAHLPSFGDSSDEDDDKEVLDSRDNSHPTYKNDIFDDKQNSDFVSTLTHEHISKDSVRATSFSTMIKSSTDLDNSINDVTSGNRIIDVSEQMDTSNPQGKWTAKFEDSNEYTVENSDCSTASLSANLSPTIPDYNGSVWITPVEKQDTLVHKEDWVSFGNVETVSRNKMDVSSSVNQITPDLLVIQNTEQTYAYDATHQESSKRNFTKSDEFPSQPLKRENYASSKSSTSDNLNVTEKWCIVPVKQIVTSDGEVQMEFQEDVIATDNLGDEDQNTPAGVVTERNFETRANELVVVAMETDESNSKKTDESVCDAIRTLQPGCLESHTMDLMKASSACDINENPSINEIREDDDSTLQEHQTVNNKKAQVKQFCDDDIPVEITPELMSCTQGDENVHVFITTSSSKFPCENNQSPESNFSIAPSYPLQSSVSNAVSTDYVTAADGDILAVKMKSKSDVATSEEKENEKEPTAP